MMLISELQLIRSTLSTKNLIKKARGASSLIACKRGGHCNDARQVPKTDQVVIQVDEDHVALSDKRVFLTQKEPAKQKWAANYWEAQYERFIKWEEFVENSFDQKGIQNLWLELLRI